MHYSKIIKCDYLNGSGIGVSLFTSGCLRACKGCFSPQTHDFNFGKLFTEETEKEILEELEKPFYDHFSIIGGNPTELQNIDTIHALCYNIKTKFPNKDIWLWSGHYLREIQKCPIKRKILDVISVLIDGRFVQELYEPNLLWKGSYNQQVIDVKKTVKEGKVVLLNDN